MKSMSLQPGSARAQTGFTLIEVLITFLILAVGLLGLAGLQVTTLDSQFEAYQRAQAVMLAEDMANRIRVDALAARAGSYTVGDQYGLLADADCTVITNSADRYLCEWNQVIAGAGVTEDGQRLGSIVGARGCIANMVGSTDGESIIRVTIAWQGNSATVAPASTCGENQYGADDRFRRTASVDVVLANLAL